MCSDCWQHTHDSLSATSGSSSASGIDSTDWAEHDDAERDEAPDDAGVRTADGCSGDRGVCGAELSQSAEWFRFLGVGIGEPSPERGEPRAERNVRDFGEGRGEGGVALCFSTAARAASSVARSNASTCRHAADSCKGRFDRVAWLPCRTGF